jgi:carboxylesterase
MIIPTAEPFFFPGNRTGCLLVHGFTGAPKEMRWMGEYLNQQGYSVLGVRLAGHATLPQDILRTRWQDWLTSVEDGYDLLKGCTDQIFVIGLSLGGILTLLFSSQFPVSGLVSMSAPYAIPNDPRLPLIRLLIPVLPWINKGEPDWHNPEAAKDHVEYPKMPTRGILQLLDLIAVMRTSLPKIQAPALIIHSKHDGSVPPANAEQILAALGSRDKQLLWVENSGHVITREPDRLVAFQATDEFIRRVLASQPSQ